MDPVSLIAAALAAGKEVGKSAVKDAYDGLKRNDF